MRTLTTNSESQSERVLAKIILLGLDVHAESITVVRQIDGGMPQPAQKFSWAGLLDWLRRQREQAEAVWSCYEAGPFGYGLHRRLEVLGVRNLVVCPQSWDELSTGVKTDKGDARALCVRLALYEELRNRTPKPFQWKFTRQDLLAWLKRALPHFSAVPAA